MPADPPHIMASWSRLGLSPGADLAAIRKAYARELRQCRPDEDPQGYQQLRQAYDQLIEWLRWQTSESPACSDHSDAGELPTPAVAQHGSDCNAGAEDPQPWIESQPPEHLEQFTRLDQSEALDAVLQALREQLHSGQPAAAVATWPSVRASLERLPLDWRDEASRRCADLALQGLPDPLVLALADHFQWRSDFRSLEQLDEEQAFELDALLESLGWSHRGNPQQLRRHQRLLDLQELLDAGQQGRALLLATLSSGKHAERLHAADRPLLRALGVKADMSDTLGKVLAQGGGIRLLGLLTLLLVIALLVHGPTMEALQHWKVACGMLLAAEACRYFKPFLWMAQLIDRVGGDVQLQWPPHISWWLLLVPLAIVLNMAVVEIITVKWLKAFLCVALWVLIAHLLLSMRLEQLLRHYQWPLQRQASAPLQLLKAVLLWLPALPLTYLVLAKVHGVRAALGALGLALALASLLPGHGWLLPLLVAVMPLSCVCMQRAMEQLAQRLHLSR